MHATKCVVSFFLAVSFVASSTARADEKPNILLIFTDDQGRGDVSCYGSEIPTPNIDSLARDGMKFENWYVAAPVCTPSRFGLLTGMYPNRSQDLLLGALMSLGPNDATRGIHEGETTLATILARVGYRTGLVGKWHLGHGMIKFLPTRHGFDSFYGHTAGCIDFFTMRYGVKPDWYRNEKLIDEIGYATDLISAEAVRFLNAQSDEKPFFLYLAYNAPHFGKGYDPGKKQVVNIMQAKPADLARVDHIDDPTRRVFGGMVVSLDDGIGRVLTSLRRNRLDDNTLVIFMTDHGGDLDYGGNNGPLRGEKNTLFEGGIRVPCLMRWPGKLKPGTVSHQHGSALDIVPTLSSIVGTERKTDQIDGIDLTPHLLGGKTIDRQLFWRLKTGDAYRDGDWKYLNIADNEDMLFNLKSDPNERKNLANEHSDVLRSLKEKHSAVVASFLKQ